MIRLLALGVCVAAAIAKPEGAVEWIGQASPEEASASAGVQAKPTNGAASSPVDVTLASVLAGIDTLSTSLGELEQRTSSLEAAAEPVADAQGVRRLMADVSRQQAEQGAQLKRGLQRVRAQVVTMKRVLQKLHSLAAELGSEKPGWQQDQQDLLPRLVTFFNALRTQGKAGGQNVPLALLYKAGYNVFDMVGFDPTDANINSLLDLHVVYPKL